MIAERNAARCSVEIDTTFRLEPLPVLSHQGNQRGRAIENRCCRFYDGVECRRRWRAEDLEIVKWSGSSIL
ncbi:hypothetical protein ASD36_24660 [Rhizobium sp. Root1334]|nr:hypothetical protein ASD36_24660 [Rhizobium sp. Root1334]